MKEVKTDWLNQLNDEMSTDLMIGSMHTSDIKDRSCACKFSLVGIGRKEKNNYNLTK